MLCKWCRISSYQEASPVVLFCYHRVILSPENAEPWFQRLQRWKRRKPNNILRNRPTPKLETKMPPYMFLSKVTIDSSESIRTEIKIEGKVNGKTYRKRTKKTYTARNKN